MNRTPHSGEIRNPSHVHCRPHPLTSPSTSRISFPRLWVSYYSSSPTHSSLQPRPPLPTCFLPPNRGFPRVGLLPISPLGHALRARAPLGLSFQARSPVGGSCVLGIPGLSIVGFLQTSGTYACHPLPRFYRRDSMGPAHRSHPCEASHPP